MGKSKNDGSDWLPSGARPPMRGNRRRVSKKRTILEYSITHWIGVLVIIIPVAIWILPSEETEQERLEREKVEAAEAAEERRKGFHCLSQWDGSHRKFKDTVEKHLNDPDSFEHVETRITPVSPNGTHMLFMKYRASNMFGGKAVATATAEVRNAGCGITVLSYQ